MPLRRMARQFLLDPSDPSGFLNLPTAHQFYSSTLSANCKIDHLGPYEFGKNFRITKHDLKVRLAFHRKPKRVKAYIAIACIALACARHMACRAGLQ